MKKVFPYYEMTASIRYGDKPWPEYPHIYLANMDISEDSINGFTRLYGRLFAECEPIGPLSKIVPGTAQEVIRKGSPTPIGGAQRALRQAWRNSPDYLEAIAGRYPDQTAFIYRPLQPLLSVTDTGLELTAPDVWTFIRLAFLRDHTAGKTKICANPDCITPYFIQSKQGNTFCCHKCAVLTNVRRFRREHETKPKIKARSTTKRHKR